MILVAPPSTDDLLLDLEVERGHAEDHLRRLLTLADHVRGLCRRGLLAAEALDCAIGGLTLRELSSLGMSTGPSIDHESIVAAILDTADAEETSP